MSDCVNYLPKITDEMVDEWDHFDTKMIEIDDDGNPQWTQDAVDFAALLPCRPINPPKTDSDVSELIDRLNYMVLNDFANNGVMDDALEVIKSLQSRLEKAEDANRKIRLTLQSIAFWGKAAVPDFTVAKGRLINLADEAAEALEDKDNAL